MTWLMKPFPLATASLITATHGGAPANLADPQPQVVWEVATPAGAWTIAVDVDLLADRRLDTFAALFHNGPAGGQWRIYARTHAAGPPAAIFGDDPADALFPAEGWGLRPASADGVIEERRAHALKVLPAAVSRRYLRIYFYWPPGASLQPFRLGVLAIGERLEPGREAGELGGFDWGAGRRIDDMSVVHQLPDGSQAAWLGTKVPEVQGSFKHLTAAEAKKMWALVRAAGVTEPLLLCEADDGLGAASLADRLHYGALTKIDFFARTAPNKAAFDLLLRNWL